MSIDPRMFNNIFLVCNKCYSPRYRGKCPYYITECGHIFCQACQQQCEKQPCPQCQRTDIVSIRLEDPLPPQVYPLFQYPMLEILEQLRKVEIFRNIQMKIVMQRFYVIDKMYEILKSQYWKQQRDLKVATERYMNLKKRYEKISALNKKLQLAEMQRRPLPLDMYHVYRMRVMPPSSDTSSMRHSSTGLPGYSMESLHVKKSAMNLTPIIEKFEETEI